MRLFKNADELPPAPNLTKKDCYNWAWQLVKRSQGYADANRFAAFFIGPIIAALITITGAAGVFTALIPDYKELIAVIVLCISAVAGALNTLLVASSPGRLYKSDRITQERLWELTTKFSMTDALPVEEDEKKRCGAFVAEVLEVVGKQIRDWANDDVPSKRRSSNRRSGADFAVSDDDAKQIRRIRRNTRGKKAYP
ncbi:hypothetical protein [Rhizobium sp. IMFF44]|uniref:hypothetical protein n=1 Tax=Rhizobium sp. IMFF44 TaxID=3342350 RepID=UPI0035B81393